MKRYSLIAIAAIGIFVAAKYDDTFFALKKNFTIFGKLYEELALGYVDPIDPTKLMRTGINSMMQGLDPYTVYFDEADNEDAQISQMGGLGSVGVGVGKREGKMTVIELLEGYSGEEQGVRMGDEILEINNQDVSKMNVREVMGLLNGEPKSNVSVKIKRNRNQDAIIFTLVRKMLDIKNVPYSGFVADDSTRGLGYIRLSQFGRGCAAEVFAAAKKLKDSGKLKGLIFDLRGNGGGLLDQAINIVSMFVPEGSKIVSTRGRFAETEQSVSSNSPPLLGDVPLVILVDHGSASASEVVSGAIQDLDRGIVMGQNTYGKGLVQNVKPLPYNTSMKLTIAKYYTPSGRCIQAINYAARDEDGNALPVPDSLRKVFKTKNGRIVKDGKGVDPDVLLPNGDISELEEALQQKASFLFFANHFAEKNAALPANFDVNDRVYGEFQTWLKSQNFTFQTKSEKALTKLKSELEKAGFGNSSRRITDIQRQIEQDKAQEFARHAERLKQQLKAQILARYNGNIAQIKSLLIGDAAIKEAEKLMLDKARYEKLLKP